MTRCENVTACDEGDLERNTVEIYLVLYGVGTHSKTIYDVTVAPTSSFERR